MPKVQIDYSKTIMYKLCCNDLNITDIYIGHTTNFTKRKNQHKSYCNNEHKKEYNFKIYNFIRENGGWNNWSMIMIENYLCNSELEAKKKERELIENLKPTLNSNIPTRTKKERYENNINNLKDREKKYQKKAYENNKEKILEVQKEYYKNNKEKILERLKEKFNCECGGCYTIGNKNHHFKTKRHQEYNKDSLN
jgi:hypothetical protein